MGMHVTEPSFLKKKTVPKMGKVSQKICFFEFIEKLGHYFFLSLIRNETLYYLLNMHPIFGKNLVPEIWAKRLFPN